MIALVFGTMAVSANDGKLSTTDTRGIIYELDSEVGTTTIKLTDANGNIIYFENIEKTNYAKRFDLKKLKDGLYFFTEEDSLKTTVYTISVEDNDVKMVERKEKAKPVFRKANGMVYLNLLNLNKKEVAIKVYDSSNRLVFSEKRDNEMIIEKVFNFTQAFEDSYTIVVTDSNNTYYEAISVN